MTWRCERKFSQPDTEDEIQEAKRAFFDEHLPAARTFADRRLRQLARWLNAGKAVAEKRSDVIGELRDLRNLEVALEIEKQDRQRRKTYRY